MFWSFAGGGGEVQSETATDARDRPASSRLSFYCAVPGCDTSRRGSQAQPQSENSIVFVVDDDPGALESLRWMIEQADFRVKAFSSGRQFLDSYRPGETGCLVLDVRMPEMDGLALQQTLRERKIRLPIIFLTAYGDVLTCASAFRGGAVAFLEKPVDSKVLLTLIKKLIAEEEQGQGN